MAKAKSVNERALATVNVGYDHPSLAWFKPFIDAWHEGYSGPVPSAAMLFTAACTATRGAGKQTAAVAMALRPDGYTVGQLRTGFNSGPAHNHTDTLVDVNRKGIKQAGGLFSRTKAGGQGDSTFTLTFTEAGEKWLANKLISHGLKKAPKAAAVKVARKRNAKAEAEAEVFTPSQADAYADDNGVPGHVDLPEPATAEALLALAAQYNS